VTDTEKVSDWARFYLASQPSYKVWALVAVLENDPKLFDAVVKKLDLTLRKLCEVMKE